MFGTKYHSQEEAFSKNLPATLYMSHYELSMQFPDWTPTEWRRYLKEKERFIMTEISAMTEANARQALAHLASGSLTAQQVSAIKQLLERSEQINSQDKDARTFVMLQFDTGLPEPDPTHVTREQVAAQMLQNDNNVRKLYGTYPEDSYRIRNHDNTLYFTDTSRMNDLDHAYMRLFNPDNKKVDKIPEYHKPEGFDVQ